MAALGCRPCQHKLLSGAWALAWWLAAAGATLAEPGGTGLAHALGRRPLQQPDACGATEYYCGDADTLLATAYAAASANCTRDDDLQVYVCGDTVLTSAEWQAVQGAGGSCLSACALSSAALVSAAQYFWTAGAWGNCSAACGGGSQSRAATCVNSVSGAQAGASLCDSGSKPAVRRACNQTPCPVQQRGVGLRFGAWGACEAACGSGSAARAAACVDAAGNLADMSACPAYSGAQLSRPCAAPAACSGPHWAAGGWGACSESCGGGTAIRSVACVDGSGRPAAAAACAGLAQPPGNRTCGTQPCVTYAWTVGDWGACSASCGGGVRNRTVGCADARGRPANASLCAGRKPAAQLQCNVLPCDFCGQTNCAGQGVCKGGVCVCQPGYRGAYCEIPPQCAGILDSAGNCCASGTIDFNGTCCAAGAVLDQSARCCASGALNGCGACSSAPAAVDALGACCAGGILDAAGLCCASRALDECGVCDGDSQSCALAASVTLQVPDPRALLALGTRAAAGAMQAFLASLLLLNGSSLQLSGWPLAWAAPAQGAASLQLDFTAQPGGGGSASQDLRAATATATLQEGVGSAPPTQLLLLASVQRVARTPVCGNQVCEAGERPGPGNAAGCAADCPWQLLLCPSAGGRQCAGAGRCLSALGACVCHIGYAGADCSQCAEGYIRAGSGCARYVRADLPLLDASSSASVIAVLAAGAALAVLGAILLAVAAAVVLRQRRQLAAYRRLGRRASKKESPVAVRVHSRSGGASEAAPEAAEGSGGSALTARAASIVQVARMRGETAATAGPSSGGGSGSRTMLASLRSSGRLRKLPRLRGDESAAEGQAGGGRAAERAAFRRRLSLVVRAGSGSPPSAATAAAAQSTAHTSPTSVLDAAAALECSPPGAVAVSLSTRPGAAAATQVSAKEQG